MKNESARYSVMPSFLLLPSSYIYIKIHQFIVPYRSITTLLTLRRHNIVTIYLMVSSCMSLTALPVVITVGHTVYLYVDYGSL